MVQIFKELYSLDTVKIEFFVELYGLDVTLALHNVLSSMA